MPGGDRLTDYGHRHEQERARWKRIVDQGDTYCWRGGPNCVGWLDPALPWHLGHDDHDRTKYKGPECVPCNVGTSTRASNEARRVGATERDWRGGDGNRTHTRTRDQAGPEHASEPPASNTRSNRRSNKRSTPGGGSNTRSPDGCGGASSRLSPPGSSPTPAAGPPSPSNRRSPPSARTRVRPLDSNTRSALASDSIEHVLDTERDWRGG